MLCLLILFSGCRHDPIFIGSVESYSHGSKYGTDVSTVVLRDGSQFKTWHVYGLVCCYRGDSFNLIYRGCRSMCIINGAYYEIMSVDNNKCTACYVSWRRSQSERYS